MEPTEIGPMKDGAVDLPWIENLWENECGAKETVAAGL
jgi:hypothetical protein